MVIEYFSLLILGGFRNGGSPTAGQLVGWYWKIPIKWMFLGPRFRKFPHLFGTCARSGAIWKIPWQGQQCKVVPTCANESAPWHSKQESLQCTWNRRMLPGNYFGYDLGMSIGDTSSTVSSSCSNRAEQLPATHWRSSCFPWFFVCCQPSGIWFSMVIEWVKSPSFLVLVFFLVFDHVFGWNLFVWTQSTLQIR